MINVGQLAHTTSLVHKSGISEERFQQLLDSGKFEALLQEFHGQVVLTSFKVTLRLGSSHLDMVRGCTFDYGYPDFEEINYCANEGNLSGKVVETKLLHLGCAIRQQAVLPRLEALQLLPEPLEVLCALARDYPDLQRKFHIVAAGSDSLNSEAKTSRDAVQVPSIFGSKAARFISLNGIYPTYLWDDNVRFLVRDCK